MDDLKTIVLGTEYDNDLIRKLKQILIDKGGKIVEEIKGIGGSQEFKQYSVIIDGVTLIVEIETYIGVSITGPGFIVNGIAHQIKGR